MSLVSEALGSSKVRIVLGVIAAWAGFQLWLTLAAPGKISPELGGTSEKVNVQVDLPFVPETVSRSGVPTIWKGHRHR